MEERLKSSFQQTPEVFVPRSPAPTFPALPLHSPRNHSTELGESEMRMRILAIGFILAVGALLIAVAMIPRNETEWPITEDYFTAEGVRHIFLDDSEDETEPAQSMTLEYDYYRETCPQAEEIVRSTMADIYSQHQDVSAALLRLFFHDCFIEGCDASVFLDDSNGNKNYMIERQAAPHRTLRGFDKIGLIKEKLEESCPGVVSCSDTIALATREGIVLAGGPFYPVFTGRKDSTRSYYDEALADIPKPDENITETLRLFGSRGFNERETVALLGAHSIGRISCNFFQTRLYNFSGTGRPDPNIPGDFLVEMRTTCHHNPSNRNDSVPAIVSGSSFDTHYFQSLLRGRGLLISDQQLMADERTARSVHAYALDEDASAFRIDFARVMVKMSLLNVLKGSEGQVRTNCSLSLQSS